MIDEETAFQEGKQAAENNRTAKESCPYFFERFPGLAQEAFDSFKRPLLTAWFRGYRTGIPFIHK